MSNPKLYSIWHLNLMYSSISEERRTEVIQKCFWPLFRLADQGYKIGIEAPALTLEIANQLDPQWIAKLKEYLSEGKAEFVGSGYTQMIGSLVPNRVNQWNIQLGKNIYKQLLNIEPKVWMLNEQTYSQSLAEHYLDNGINTIVVDSSNVLSLWPELDSSIEFQSQRTLDLQSRSINLLWSSSLAFQKFQRRVHGEVMTSDYSNYLNDLYEKMNDSCGNSSYCIYGNDAEIFDFRPGRFKTEANIQSSSEWAQVEQVFAEAKAIGFAYCLPSEVIRPNSNSKPLSLTNLVQPNLVKKQPKYNVCRWSLTGRFSPKANQMCFDLLNSEFVNEPDATKIICRLWSSDFRTHITEERWNAFIEELSGLHSKWVEKKENLLGLWSRKKSQVLNTSNPISFKTNAFEIELNPLRGLSISALGVRGNKSIAGHIPHGTYSRMDLSADWYTGNIVLQLPGEAQKTDLRPRGFEKHIDESELWLKSSMELGGGECHKLYRFNKNNDSFELEFNFQNVGLPVGSLRLGFLTLVKYAIDNHMFLTSHLGGAEPEIFQFPTQEFDHGQSASSLVSSNQAMGMTEGWFQISTKQGLLRVDILSSTIRPLLMVEKKIAKEGDFVRLYLSVSEYDETRRGPWNLRDEHIRLCIKVER